MSVVVGKSVFPAVSSRLSTNLSGLLFDLSPDALIVIDNDCNLVSLNSKARELFGYPKYNETNVKVQAIVPGWPEYMSEESIRLSYRNSLQMITKAKKWNGEYFDVGLTLNVVLVDDQLLIIAAVRDVSIYSEKQHHLEEINDRLQIQNGVLENLSNTDPLTGLLNRRGLERVLVREINYSKRNNSALLATLIDLDDFKSINDSYGHSVGDMALKQATQIFQANLRSIDWLARVGGDEFLILLPCTTLYFGGSIIERIRAVLNESFFNTELGPIHMTASMGIVSLPSSVSTIENVIELTQAILKDCKRSGKNRVTIDSEPSRELLSIKDLESSPLVDTRPINL